jgi:hypothetical protein
MDRAHREDYAYKDACEDAARALGRVLDSGRVQRDDWRMILGNAQSFCDKEAAHIVAAWD